MKLENVNSETTELFTKSDIEKKKIYLVIILDKIREIREKSAIIDDREIDYFMSMVEILVQNKVIFLNYEYE